MRLLEAVRYEEKKELKRNHSRQSFFDDANRGSMASFLPFTLLTNY